ncbi:unnamed protein product [Trichogramma brassicae]|uniref:Uncharacterized protein n=1 Tax=Trichogramma brassicae TaxID=86971 RepID=A0A6H5I7Q5_9HYME|nr:unnamed protein product [Trichogramma brassicae]
MRTTLGVLRTIALHSRGSRQNQNSNTGGTPTRLYLQKTAAAAAVVVAAASAAAAAVSDSAAHRHRRPTPTCLQCVRGDLFEHIYIILYIYILAIQRAARLHNI